MTRRRVGAAAPGPQTPRTSPPKVARPICPRPATRSLVPPLRLSHARPVGLARGALSANNSSTDWLPRRWKSPGPNWRTVDQAQHQGVDQRPELLQQVQHQRRPAVGRLMKEPQHRLHARAVQFRFNHASQHGITEGEQGVDGVSRGAAITAVERELLVPQQLAEVAEIQCRRLSLQPAQHFDIGAFGRAGPGAADCPASRPTRRPSAAAARVAGSASGCGFFPPRSNRATLTEKAGSVARRYCSRRSTTFLAPRPTSRPRKSPARVRKTRSIWRRNKSRSAPQVTSIAPKSSTCSTSAARTLCNNASPRLSSNRSPSACTDAPVR